MLIDNKKVVYKGKTDFNTFHTIATNEELECIYNGRATLISVAPKNGAICISREEFTKLLLDVFHDWIVEFCQNTRKDKPTVKNINYAKFKVICITILVCVFLMLSFLQHLSQVCQMYHLKISHYYTLDPLLISIYQLPEKKGDERFSPDLYVSNLYFNKKLLFQFLGLRNDPQNYQLYTDEALNLILDKIELDENNKIFILDDKLNKALIKL